MPNGFDQAGSMAGMDCLFDIAELLVLTSKSSWFKYRRKTDTCLSEKLFLNQILKNIPIFKM